MRCETTGRTISLFHIERNVIDENPPYQRESGVWSVDKKRLLIDSIRRGYDLPKLYLHELDDHPTLEYAVIDGKQRLDAIWCFLNDDFRLEPAVGEEQGALFSELSEEDRERFKASLLDVVLVRDADIDEIEELFSRLNNGEALSSAEKRNAFGGRMAELVREVATTNSFFEDKVKFSGKRMSYYEATAKLILIEKTVQSGGSPFCDLKKKFLDALVKDNKDLSDGDYGALKDEVDQRLLQMSRVFGSNDPLLDKQAYVPMYYLLVRHLYDTYANNALPERIYSSLESFKVSRAENLQLPEEERDPVLLDFGRLIAQGTNDRTSLESRVRILSRHFIEENPDLPALDGQRLFNNEERHVLWVRAGRCCEGPGCGRSLDFEEVHADHVVRHADGGITELSNGQCLCEPCNLARG
jgi:hypothetical protein